jgi:translation initiation factor IF-3
MIAKDTNIVVSHNPEVLPLALIELSTKTNKQRIYTTQMMTNFNNKDNATPRIRINGFIRAAEVRVINSEKEMLGVMKIADALKLAQEQGKDVIEINPKADPPIVLIENFGRYQYEQSKKEKAEKKKQQQLEMKVIECRPTTEEFDLSHKLEKIKEFLLEGRRCRIVCKFKGREMSFRQLGQDKLTYMLEQLADLISGYTPISMEGRDMSTVISPKSNKQ